MRDYVITQAASAAPSGLIGQLAGLLRNWRARRAVGRLDHLDDYMLRDIGVTREEVQWASGLPLTVNAALALEERAVQRRRSGTGIS